MEEIQQFFSTKAAWKRHKKAVLEIHAEQWAECRPVRIQYDAPPRDFLADFFRVANGGTAIRRQHKRQRREMLRKSGGV